MKTNTKKIILSLLGLGVLLTLIFGSETVPQYEFVEISKNDVKNEVDFTSSWYPVGYSKIDLGDSSSIKKINVKEGQSIEKGKVIAELNNTQEYNQYKMAWASYNAAIYNKRLVEENPLATDNQIKAAQQQVNSAYYQMKNAEYAMNQKKIKAPIKGVVVAISKRDYDKSASLSSSAMLGGSSTDSGNYIIIANKKDATFSAQVSEREILMIEKGDTVNIATRFDSKLSVAKVTYVSATPILSGEDPYYEILVKFDEYPKQFPYGIKLEGNITTNSKKDTLSVRYDAITVDSDTNGSVIILENDELKTKTVEIGIVGDEYVEVISGISEGEQIVVDQLEDKKIIGIRPWLKKLFKKN